MKSVILSGFMATGKTTIGRVVAQRLGLPFVDTDALVAEEANLSVPELFAREGEAKFRDREAAIIQALLAEDTTRVIAFGGGAVTIPRVRHWALERATVITLTAPPEVIAARAGQGGEGRPNLEARSPTTRARDLLALRREAYGECHATLATDSLSVEEAAARIVEIARREGIAVPLGARSYVVELGDGEPAMLTAALSDLSPSSVIVVTDANVLAARGAWLDQALESLDARSTRIVLVPGEAHKNIQSVIEIWDRALEAGLDRNAVVVAFGGGVVGDMAGFAAATLLRGVRCVQIPTSLLAMVDSSVGGKTGFDHATGKNLLGAFFQPSRVLVDLEHLTTLPPREAAAGMAEVVKIALACDAELLSRLEDRGQSIQAELRERGRRTILQEVIHAAIVAKMRVVREDEHETGARALLNLGHTVGHALEAHGGYARWLHGEAVAIGTVVELEAAARLGLGDPTLASRAAALLALFDLPTTVATSDLAAAWPFVMTDKKRVASAVKLPVVSMPGQGRVERVAIDELGRAVLG